MSTENDIIDVTGPSEKIPRANALDEKPHPLATKEVITWPHRYIYSYNDFSTATSDQRSFYFYFRDCFQGGIPVNLKGNSNYAFVLLFDLLQDYDRHANINLLRDQLRLLAQYYPVTEKYVQTEYNRRISELHKKTQPNIITQSGSAPETSVSIGTAQHKESIAGESHNTAVFTPTGLILGQKYKAILSLSDRETKLLDHFLYYSTVFFDIPFCQSAVVSTFIGLYRALDQHFQKTGSTADKEVLRIAEIIARYHYRNRTTSQEIQSSIPTFGHELLTGLLKFTENAVRNHYHVTRQLQVFNPPYSSTEVNKAIEEQLLAIAADHLPFLLSVLPVPDKQTDIYLSTQNTARWKAQLDEIKAVYKADKDSKGFLQEVLNLAKRNQKNPSIEHIFFEASKFIGKDNKAVCLSLYVHYIYYDQRSEKVDDKPLNKTLLKSFLLKSEQQNAFEALLGQLKTDKDLPKALKATADLFEVKRKKLRLDDSLIGEAEAAYTDTVELLNEYLVDDQEAEPSPKTAIPDVPAPTQTILASPVPVMPETDPDQEKYPAFLQLKPVQQALLDLFARHNLLLGATDLEEFAKEQGVFRNQLIDSINEACYEILDDVLIEEEDDNYLIQQHYYQRVSQP